MENPGFSSYARELIRHKAWTMIGKCGLTKDERRDLEQDLALDLLTRQSKYDPSRASVNTFSARVVEHAAANILRRRGRQMRDYRRRGPSLDQPLGDGSGDTHGDLRSQDDYDLETGRHSRPEVERIDMRIDVQAAVAGLPPDFKVVAVRLTTDPVAKVARDLGVPRSTFYESMVAPMRKLFEDKGLRDYL